MKKIHRGTITIPLYSKKFIVGCISLAIMLALLFVPVVAVNATQTFKIEQTKMEPYEVVETRNESYQETELQPISYNVSKTVVSDLGGIETEILRPDKFDYWSGSVHEGANVEFVASVDGPVDVYIMSSAGFSDYPYTAKMQKSSLAHGEQKEFFKFGFIAPKTDTYYFILHNGGGNEQDVNILYGKSIAKLDTVVQEVRQEQVAVTKYREVTGPVTKYKEIVVPVLQERQVTRNGSIIEYLAGKDLLKLIQNLIPSPGKSENNTTSQANSTLNSNSQSPPSPQYDLNNPLLYGGDD